MSIINISLDTQSRQLVLAIDGVIVPADGLDLYKYKIDGEENISFSYSIQSINGQGLKERRQFYLPSLEELATEAHAGLNKDGLAFKIVHDDEKAKADTIKFIQNRNK